MNVRARPEFLLALLAVGALYALARTQRGGVVAADVVGGVMDLMKPRGIRNNNPGNIDWIANPVKRWRGMLRKETAAEGGRFGVFDTAANGVRAIGGELKASIRRGHTVEEAIYEWAPPTENNSDAYAKAVAREIGVPRTALLTLAMLPAAATGIIEHENGQQPYAPADIARWVYS